LYERPVFPPHCNTEIFAAAALFSLRARAARKPNSKVGLGAAIRQFWSFDWCQPEAVIGFAQSGSMAPAGGAESMHSLQMPNGVLYRLKRTFVRLPEWLRPFALR